MRNPPLRSGDPNFDLSVSELKRFADGWFLDYKKLSCCGTMELRVFLSYVDNGHNKPGGRWQNPQLTEPVRPRTVRDFYLEHNPLASLKTPISRADQVKPFTPEQVFFAKNLIWLYNINEVYDEGK